MIAIKDMEEMPKSCVECPYGLYWGSISTCIILGNDEIDIQENMLKGTRYEYCPLTDAEGHKVGKWIVKDNGNGGKYVECPFCGALAPCTEFADRAVWKYSKFCYDCGNELRGTENG